MSARIGLLVFTASLAACSSDTTYKLGGYSLTERDSGYLTADYFCQAAGQGQLRLDIVDFNPICGGNIAPDADGGARDPQLEHNELELIFTIGGHGNEKLPYEVSAPDCMLGPAGPGIAYFNHYASGNATPVVTVAQSGNLYLTSYDSTGKNPAVGSFNLDFGAAGKLSGNFSTYTCN